MERVKIFRFQQNFHHRFGTYKIQTSIKVPPISHILIMDESVFEKMKIGRKTNDSRTVIEISSNNLEGYNNYVD